MSDIRVELAPQYGALLEDGGDGDRVLAATRVLAADVLGSDGQRVQVTVSAAPLAHGRSLLVFRDGIRVRQRVGPTVQLSGPRRPGQMARALGRAAAMALDEDRVAGRVLAGAEDDRVAPALRIEVAPALFEDAAGVDGIASAINVGLAERLHDELGLYLPPATVARHEHLEGNEVRIVLDEETSAPIETDGASRTETMQAIEQLLRRRPAQLVTRGLVRALVRVAASTAPQTVEATLRMLDETALARLFAGLAAEAVPLRDVEGILDATMRAQGRLPARGYQGMVAGSAVGTVVPEGDADSELLAAARIQIGGAMNPLLRTGADVPTVGLAPELDRAITMGRPIASDDLAGAILGALQRSFAPVTALAVTDTARPRVRKLLDVELPELPIFGFQELVGTRTTLLTNVDLT